MASTRSLAFADEYGLPIAIKAAFGGGGRGLKVAREREEIAELFESAVREAVAAFGRGECFVERYLDKPRHVETQVLADSAGNVVVVSTRDCSLQRRYQKLVEEAPAPFLTEEQIKSSTTPARPSARRPATSAPAPANSSSARTASISFLEVNTRLQVEHPVTEEVTGIDLVRWQFRIADGDLLDFEDPASRGHAIEFRINGEDPGRGFLPAPGAVTKLAPPLGPGVRTDTGIEAGSVIGGQFDSLLAKIIVTGATRTEAIERSRRALDEFVVEGMATALPFHQAVVRDPAFAPGRPGGRLHRPQPVDRDRVRQHDPAVHRRGGRRGGGRRARAGRRRGRRQAARGRTPGGARCGIRARRRSGQGQEAGPQALCQRACGSFRRLADQPHAGHHRQGRRRRRRHRGGRRHDRRPRGDEDGAAAHGPQGRHRHRFGGHRRRDGHQRSCDL